MKLYAAVLLLVIAWAHAQAAKDRQEEASCLPLPTPEQRARREKLSKEIAALEKQLQTGGSEFEAEQRAWEAEMARPIEWQPLIPVDAKADGGARLTVDADGTLVETGRAAGAVAFAITARTPLRGITAFRIELLPNAAARGKGRIRELCINVRGRGGNRVRLALRDVSSDVESGDRDIARIIDGKEATEWRFQPPKSEPHFIVAGATAPVAVGETGETELLFQIVQNHGSNRALSRFKLAATTTAPPVRALSRALREILAIEPTERSDAQRQQVADYFRPLSESARKVNAQIAEKKAALAKLAGSDGE